MKFLIQLPLKLIKGYSEFRLLLVCICVFHVTLGRACLLVYLCCNKYTDFLREAEDPWLTGQRSHSEAARNFEKHFT